MKRRTGVPLGGNGSLGNMLKRSFGATTIGGFWRHWNPIFGYYLGRYVYDPTSRFAPRWLALLVTFLACGALHDGVTLVFRGTTRFLFSLSFLFFSLGLVLSERAGWNMAARPFRQRAVAHSGYVLICFVLAGATQRAVFG